MTHSCELVARPERLELPAYSRFWRRPVRQCHVATCKSNLSSYFRCSLTSMRITGLCNRSAC